MVTCSSTIIYMKNLGEFLLIVMLENRIKTRCYGVLIFIKQELPVQYIKVIF